MEVKLEQYIELRGDNPLKAVVSGTEANAHLVASAALVNGIDETAEQYNLREAQVYGALAFYYENKDAIEQYRQRAEKEVREIGMDSRTHLEELRKRNLS